jgi:hypothetical protein
MFTRRLGPDPHGASAPCASLDDCPDILELDDGEFAIIGLDATESLKPHLAFGASCGADERIIRVPRNLLVRARPDIPAE